jgi:hypothetical protein
MFVGMRQSLGHALDSKKRDAEAAVSAWTEMVRCGHLSVQGFVGPRACPDMKFRGEFSTGTMGNFQPELTNAVKFQKPPHCTREQKGHRRKVLTCLTSVVFVLSSSLKKPRSTATLM